MCSLARAAYVDDVRVAVANVVDVDAQSFPHVREVVGDEDVGGLDEPVQQLAPLVGRDVEPDGTLPAVGDLEHEVDAVAARNETRGHEAPLRVTAGRMLDLDDVGAPLREHRARDRDERPRRHLDHAGSGQHVQHSTPKELTARRHGARRLLRSHSRRVQFPPERAVSAVDHPSGGGAAPPVADPRVQ